MKKVIRLSLVVALCSVIGISIQSCKSTKDNVKNTSADSTLGNIKIDLAGTWILKSLNGQNVNDIFKGKTPSMTLDFETNQVSGNGGCNSYSGMFSYKDGIFSTSKVASTLMACVMENKEGEFHDILSKENSLEVVNGVLTLTNNGVTVAEFVKGIDTRMLSGTWKLESIAGEDMKALFTLEEKLPTLEFHEMDKMLSGNAGCNTYRAPYVINGMLLEVSPMISTKMACPNLAGEGKFSSALAGTSTIHVTKDKLTLSKDGKVVLTFVK